MSDISFFYGVRVGLDVPRSIAYAGYRLKSVYVDLLDKYVSFWSSVGDQAFHEYLVGLARAEYLKVFSDDVVYCFSRYDGGSVPDISVSKPFLFPNVSVYFEIETGLKRSLLALELRLARAGRRGIWTYVIVPNRDVKARYKRVLPAFHGRIFTLRDFVFSLTRESAFF